MSRQCQGDVACHERLVGTPEQQETGARFGSEPFGQRAESGHGPSFVRAARARIDRDQPVATLDALLDQKLLDPTLGRRGHGYVELGGSRLDAEGREEREVLLEDVAGRGGRRHVTIGEERVPALATHPHAEPDAQGRAGVRGEQPALEEPLEVNGRVEGGASDALAKPSDLAQGGLPMGAR